MNKYSLTILACACVVLAASTAQAAGDVAAGKAKAEDCADCHGDDGKGDDKNPAVAGMSAEKFTKALQEYQNGVRTKSPKMTKEAKGLSAEDVANLAAYYATLKK